ncbi:MAG: response regulator transcription factor [Bifidobacterium tibiigranuli]|jgi:DNA-binding NarL/FixJ family response regulator|uniref:response regulator transcription factor n=1 Tax=Bifidobacterium tibiigranuli TaxID=2172043 RepID=UPI002353657D|nr:response regulator transcription factor [Bifidobacterium tibiigranuli]MCH3974586.1 response regulator transcription factor [Bifidobacterium tibiigranuli]MCH4189504.1 response regulator transcription factor [Bifidobacterium tibiigranuli]MCH4204327.1 response regulator transcription factor [Bifidobacterium tibiigranuli]MCH4275374.1 response regulator transcription factor [Bifidobacterium tibiigranuli]MCI1791579.1 response regulator transcription factor [Bifidobacterium tibiigranuli]
MAISIAIVDNDALSLAALSQGITVFHPAVHILWTATTGMDAVKRCLSRSTQPEVLLTDLSMEDISGVAVCRAIMTKTSHTAVLGITSYALSHYVSQLAEAGAQSIVPKTNIKRICFAIDTVASGKVYSPDPAVIFQSSTAAHRRLEWNGDSAYHLTEREATILALCSDGLTTERIMDALCISEATVKTHVKHILRKLGAKNRAQAVAIWMRSTSL